MTTPADTHAIGGSRAATLGAVHLLAWLATALMGGASALGLLMPAVYRDNALVTAGWRGTDLVTLAVGVPLLALAAWRSERGSEPWRLTLLGMLLYALYNYSFYLFGAAFNALFLVYVAIVTASSFGLLLALRALDEERAAPRPFPRAPRRAVAAFMQAVGVLLGGFWISLSVASVFTGEPPAMVVATAHPTNVTGALDLSVVVPLALLGGVWLRQGRAWGYVVAVVWNVKGAVYMLALSSASVSAYAAGAVRDVAQLGLWLPIGLGCLAATAALLRENRPGGGGAHSPERERPRHRMQAV